MQYVSMNKNDISSYLKSPVIFPIGAIEQHGDNLPLGTDTLILDAIFEKLAIQIGDKALVLPTQWVGLSTKHALFPGTLSLSKETIRYLIHDVASWLSESGFLTMVIVNSYSGNEVILKTIIDEWNKNYKLELIYYDIWSEVTIQLNTKLSGGIDLHAGDSERLVICALREDLVKEDVLSQGYLPRYDTKSTQGFYAKSISGAVNFRESIAIDHERGMQLVEQMKKDFLAFLESLIKN